jgi:STE24 endopeptidase
MVGQKGKEAGMKQPSIHPLLDKDKQEKSRRYERQKRLIGLGSSLWTLLLLAGFFLFLSRRLAFEPFGGSFILTFSAYIAVFHLLLWALGLPWDFYGGFLHEHRWGFSNQTRRAWFWDQVKSLFLGLILFWLLLGLLLWILARFPQWWWLAAGLSTAAVGVVLTTLFPVVILPLFFKYTPMDDPELVGALEKILAREGLRPGGFFKEDMSRKSKKENAFLAGLGKTRRVVLADNLLTHMDGPQIESIIAHEVGHYRHRHIWKNILIGTIEQLLVFFLVDGLMRSFFPSFLISSRHNLALIPVFLGLVGGLSAILFGPASQALSRYFEKQADLYALRNIPDTGAFKLAMAGLANRNLSNAYPAKWVKWLYYSHPPIGERLAAAEEFERYSVPSQQ